MAQAARTRSPRVVPIGERNLARFAEALRAVDRDLTTVNFLISLGAPASDGQFLVATGAGTATWESGATARDSIGLGTSSNPQFATIELGHATANTLSASGGILSVEGVAQVNLSTSQTLTNKTLSSPTLSGTVAGSPTFTGAPVVTDKIIFQGSTGRAHFRSNSNTHTWGVTCDRFVADDGIFAIFHTNNGDLIRGYPDLSLVVGAPSGGPNMGAGTINAQGVYDDGSLLSCYVMDAALDGDVDLEKWDARVPNRIVNEPAKSEWDRGTYEFHFREHEPAAKFKARLGTEHDPLTLDGYAAHWKEKRHLTSMPNEERYDIKRGLSTGEWIQRLVETVEIQAVLIEQLNQKIKALEARAP